MATSDSKIVDSKVDPLEKLFLEKFDVDFYQREYVWQRKQVEDLIMDLSGEFLKNWKPGDQLPAVASYDPYYMGEIVLSMKNGQRSDIIDGQQRITTLTLLLIYLAKTYGHVPKFPDLSDLIYSDFYGDKLFNLDIEERRDCLLALFDEGEYMPKDTDTASVRNIVERYADFDDCWNDRIDEGNVVHFAYWLKTKVVFSKVWTNSDEFAYVIFETMNDRGLSLTQVEMLRSYLLANISEQSRGNAMRIFDEVVRRLTDIKLTSKSKAEFEFFKVLFRCHYAEDLSQSPTSNSDFIRIGKEFHRWVRDKSEMLGLSESGDFVDFVNRIDYYSRVYARIHELIQARDAKNYLYLIVNADYGFTLQPAAIIASVKYQDSAEIVDAKIKVVSRYLTKVLSWRTWNHYLISQSSLEAPVYEFCKGVRGMNVEELEDCLKSSPIHVADLSNAPTLNQQNRKRIRVLIALISAIVADASGEPSYMLNERDIEVEHIWADHYEQHKDEFESEDEFASVRNSIGDLLVLPKSFNASYGDDPYEAKVEHYFGQNILAQTLSRLKYVNAPGFAKFKDESGLPFKPYDQFTRSSVIERAELYRDILLWNWR